MVMKNDDVYSLGSNSAGCLGVESLTSSLTPMKVDALCGKGIKGLQWFLENNRAINAIFKRRCYEFVSLSIVGFSYGAGPHVVAYTHDGLLYAWGHNGFCQLGLGNSCQTVVPSLVTGSLTGKKVVQVACGSHHTMALTSDGDIYAWGQNSSGQVGCGSTANQPTPRRVSAVIGNCKIVSIACGQTSSFAISENGEVCIIIFIRVRWKTFEGHIYLSCCFQVYAWGYNGNGQLGIGNTVNQYNPTKVVIPSAFIISVILYNFVVS